MAPVIAAPTTGQGRLNCCASIKPSCLPLPGAMRDFLTNPLPSFSPPSFPEQVCNDQADKMEQTIVEHPPAINGIARVPHAQATVRIAVAATPWDLLRTRKVRRTCY